MKIYQKRLVGLLFILSLSIANIYAQMDGGAKEILAAVSKKYRSFDVVKAEFSYSLKNPQANINETQNGTLYIKSKLNKYKVAVGTQELISD